MNEDRMLRIFVKYAHGLHPQEENFARTKDLMQRLSVIHPLLASFSPIGKGMGRKQMLNEVPFPDLSYDQWLAYYLFETKRGGEVAECLGNMLTYWNRHKDNAKDTCLHINYNVFNTKFSNDFYLSDIPAALYTPEILDAIMAACIDSFDAVRADYAWLDGDYDPSFRYYQLWLRGDTSFPDPAGYDRFERSHSLPPVTEKWHHGTRFVWPHHEPNLIRQIYLGDYTRPPTPILYDPKPKIKT